MACVVVVGLIWLGFQAFDPLATDHHEEEILLGAVPLLEGHAEGLSL